MSAGTIALRLVIGGDASGGKAALKSLGTESKKAQSGLGKGLKAAQQGAAIGLAAIVGVATKGVQSYEALTKSVAALQRQSKISAEDASLLTGQWQRYGVAAEAGGKGMMMLSKQIDAANIGTKTSIDTFARLGVTLDDLKTMSPYQVLEQVRQTLSEMPPSAERTALSAKLLGKGFMTMSKWIAASSTDLDALNQQLKDSGQVMDEAELAKAKDDMKQMALLQVDLRGLFVEVGRSAMPIIRDLVPGLKKLLAVVKPLAPHLVEIGGALAAFLVVSKVATGLGTMVTMLGKLKTLLVGGKIASGLASVAESGGVLGGGGIGTGKIPARVFSVGGSGAASTTITKGERTVAQSLLAGGGTSAGVAPVAAAGGLAIPVMIAAIGAVALTGLAKALHDAETRNKESGQHGPRPTPSPGTLPGPIGSGATMSAMDVKSGYMKNLLSTMLKTAQGKNAEAIRYMQGDLQKALHLPKVSESIAADAPQTRARLLQMRDDIVKNLHVPVTEAERLVRLIFPQSWAAAGEKGLKDANAELTLLKDTLRKKIAFGDPDTGPTIAAIKVLEARIEKMRARAARPAHVGRLNTDGWVAPLNDAAAALASFRDLAAQGITPASMSSHKSWTAAHAPATPAWHAPGRALGGYVRRTPGGTLLRVGEGKYDEVIAQVLPGKGGQKAGGGETHFHFHIGQLVGTDERAARQLWNTVKPIAMSDMRMKMAMSRG